MIEGVWRFLVTGGVIVPVEVFGSGRGFVALGRFGGGPHKARGKNPRRAILTYARRWMRLTVDQIEEIVEPGQRLRAEVEAEVQAALEERDRAYRWWRDSPRTTPPWERRRQITPLRDLGALAQGGAAFFSAAGNLFLLAHENTRRHTWMLSLHSLEL